MISIRSTLMSGFIATFAASAMMQMNKDIGDIPSLHIARSLSNLIGDAGRLLPGWIAHFVLGTFVFSLIYALIERRLPVRSPALKGLLFGMLLWLGMMAVFMPLTGAGFFAIDRGVVLPVATLVLNLVYGVVLGSLYGWGTHAAGTRRVPPKSATGKHAS